MVNTMILNDAKSYLRIDYSEDDNFIQQLIDVSQIYIDECCGESYKTDAKLLKLSELAQLKLISDMYENRSGFIEEKKAKRDIIIDTIFNRLASAEVIV
jgi:uncharacterized phage protein (predicted DNA packaging)